ncbi:STAS domain-containing protein [Xanthomonas hortorum pv. vitians]|uniref:STAS domain-containing protein n=1 Tax=Xanthomonas hortorum TaxID=56454 RepID=UPI001652CBC0|nr:STAS domain-containing protein [Xanthomonas hortorum]MCE4298171.1 STAS domain-containing protein [Xanthomonas hortorum pv. vitians]MCE4368619.1 STAS domain-containing protein [Xanthomonas hortorum pv. vitians]MDA4138112.1 STAS domain-containing protein [Xanthomonas hortorum pv. vitians]QNM61422.1 Anti-anti-sigma factor [Xanthomonas hortorum pv. vitians]
MSTVKLGEDLGIETSTDLKQKLAAVLAEDGDLVLDAGEVRRIHTASVQLLCAFVQARRQAGLNTEFDGCNDTFRDAVRLLGVTDALGLSASNDNLKSVENAA